MCTAAIYKTKDFYFGRNLDYEVSYGESVAVTPRKYKFVFTEEGECAEHYAMIGMAHVSGGYPLYYDAVNEKGLCMAGLNFAKSAVYHALRMKKQASRSTSSSRSSSDSAIMFGPPKNCSAG